MSVCHHNLKWLNMRHSFHNMYNRADHKELLYSDYSLRRAHIHTRWADNILICGSPTHRSDTRRLNLVFIIGRKIIFSSIINVILNRKPEIQMMTMVLWLWWTWWWWWWWWCFRDGKHWLQTDFKRISYLFCYFSWLLLQL